MEETFDLPEEIVVPAGLSFALELERRRKQLHQRKMTGAQTVIEFDDFQPDVMGTTEEETRDQEVVMEELRLASVQTATNSTELRRMSSRLFRKTIPHIMSPPEVANERSEEEDRPVDTRRRSARNKAAAAKAKETRKEHTDIKKSIKATLRVSGRVDLNNRMNLTEQWKRMHETAIDYLDKISRRASFRESTFHAFFLNSVNSLKSTMCAARPRPPEVHSLIISFVVDLNKIYNIAYSKGMVKVAGTLPRLVEGILGKYLSSQKVMNATHVPWIQTKEVLTLLMSVIYKSDTIYGMLQCLSRTEIYFINKWAALRDRDEEFIAYAISQLQIFSSTLSRRLTTLAQRDKYGYSI